MKHIRLIAAMMLGLAVSACGTTETATRNAPLDAPQVTAPTAVSIHQLTVSVPRTLKASEKNRFYPGGDIVWREDPLGDRHAQVRAIVEEAMVKGVTGLEGQNAVNLHIEMVRFHALTEKARALTGGMHELYFKMTLAHPVTNQPLGAPRMVKANLKALGGSKAIAAERKGITQRYRITHYLADVIQDELSNTEGFEISNLGLNILEDEAITQF